MLRTAVFYISNTASPERVPIPIGRAETHNGRKVDVACVAYIRAELMPEGVDPLEAMDRAKPQRGESLMNTHEVEVTRFDFEQR